MIGKNILGYTVNEKIGSGGSGTVYRVSKTDASGTYSRALKHISIPNQKQYVDVLNRMNGDTSKADAVFKEIFDDVAKEVNHYRQLSDSGNSNIVRYYESEFISKESSQYDIYILMELLKPFPDYMNQNEIKVLDIIKLGKDILSAINLCHKNNIIHRDIKEDNIFVSLDQAETIFKLGDFGVSEKLNNGQEMNSFKGTKSYMAPEVYLGLEYDHTVDLFSLGIMLYKLLNKLKDPFSQNSNDLFDEKSKRESCERIQKGDMPDLPIYANNELGNAILPAIRARKNRYNCADDFLMALEQAEKNMSDEDLNTVINDFIFHEHKQPQKKEKEFTVSSKTNIPIEKQEKNHDDDIFKDIASKNENKPAAIEKSEDSTEKKSIKKRKKYPIIIGIVMMCLFGGIQYIKHNQLIAPDLKNHTMEEAIQITANLDKSLTINQSAEDYSDTVKKGDIISQAIAAGSEIKKSTVIDVIVSKGKQPEVPNLIGKSSEAAKEAVEKQGLIYVEKKSAFSDTYLDGTIISQDTEAGTKVEPGQIIYVVVSKGKELKEVPKLTDLAQQQAEQILSALGLKYEISEVYNESVEVGTVISQNISVGEMIDSKTPIKLEISLGSKPTTETVSVNKQTNSIQNENKGQKQKKQEVFEFYED